MFAICAEILFKFRIWSGKKLLKATCYSEATSGMQGGEVAA
jgi:hypothetical protein